MVCKKAIDMTRAEAGGMLIGGGGWLLADTLDTTFEIATKC